MTFLSIHFTSKRSHKEWLNTIAVVGKSSPIDLVEFLLLDGLEASKEMAMYLPISKGNKFNFHILAKG